MKTIENPVASGCDNHSVDYFNEPTRATPYKMASLNLVRWRVDCPPNAEISDWMVQCCIFGRVFGHLMAFFSELA